MNELDSSSRSGKLSWLWWLLGALAIIGLLYFLVQSLFNKHGPSKPSLKQITMVKIHTPPPPPPKPPEKLPEPPPQPKQEVKIDEPKPQEAPKPADEPPAPQAKLGVDSDATGEGDNFGLAANKGGRDLVGSVAGTIGGTGTGTGRTGTSPTARIQYTYYRDVMTRHLHEVLGKIPELKEQEGLIPVSIWVDKQGRIERIETATTGLSPERTELVRNALLKGPPIRQLPPDNMPQPLRLKIKVQDAG